MKHKTYKRKNKKNTKAFTIIEVLVASVILALAVGGVFVALLSAVKLVNYMRHDMMAVFVTDSTITGSRGAYEYDNDNTPGNETLPYAVDNVDGNPTTDLDPFDQPLDDETETDSLRNSARNVTTEDYGTTDYEFKRVDETVTWKEREL